MRLLRRPNLRSARAGYVQLGYAALSMLLMKIGGSLLGKKNKSPIETDKPTTLSTRGSRVNYVVGIGQVGPFVAAAPFADREIRKESVEGGGKGFGSHPRQDVFYESGWHVLGSNGPYFALHEIEQGGKIIFTGPITRDSHPSGSTVDLGEEGSFEIFWGEETQPVNTFLGNATRVGINSRWPFLFYVVWNKKRLGTSAQWPILNYVVEHRPHNTILSGSDAYIPPTETLDGATKTIFAHTNGAQGVGKFTLKTDLSHVFAALTPVALAGNTMTSGRYVVLRADVYQFELVAPNPALDPPSKGLYETRTDIYLYGGLSGANAAGTLQAYSVNQDDGINPAHAIAEILFQPWPQGHGLPTDEEEPWSLTDLEAIGVEAETNRDVSTWIASDGEKTDALLGAGLQDLGVMVPFEYTSGKIAFTRVRPPTGTLPNVSVHLEAEELPEIGTNHDEEMDDRVIFKFTDREHGFADMTIAVDEDGHAYFAEFASAREAGIKVTNNFATAARFAERRGQEQLAGGGLISIKANRAARTLLPGQAITNDEYYDVLRVVSVQLDPLSSVVTLRCIPDHYGADVTDFVNQPGGGSDEVLPPVTDLQFTFVEVPEAALLGDPMTVIVPRIRGNAQVVGSQIHFSRDNTTYVPVGLENGVQTGGTLDAQLEATGVMELDQGPTITVLGPDIGTALDLSADAVNWRLGRQLVVIRSSAGVEICYLKKVTAMGGSTYRLDGLVRARYDTNRLTHPLGAEVYIFSRDTTDSFQDLLLEPNKLLFVKSQPNTFGGAVSLAAISPVNEALYGKGVRPMELTEIEVTAPYLGSPCYGTGQDVAVRVGYRSANELTSGAGQQEYGDPVGVQTPLGTITLEFLTTGDVLKRTVVLTGTNIYTYTNALLLADFGSEVSIKVRAYQTVNGFTTPTISLTISKV